jgi:hypothetical protein
VTTIREAASRVLVVAHREDTTALVRTLSAEGFVVEEIRGPYTPEQEGWSHIKRALCNHANAWRRCVALGEDVVVCEADFVPVVRFGSRRLPCPVPTPAEPARMAWLYSAGSILYAADRRGFLYGHGQTAVCWYVSVAAARALLDYFAVETAKPNPGEYAAWDTTVSVYMRREKGVESWLVDRQLGEHGGVPSAEHARAGFRPWHHADLLAGRLAFRPAYARGARGRYLRRRALARLRALGRMVLLRYFDPRHVRAGQSRLRLSLLALRRFVLLLGAPPL